MSEAQNNVSSDEAEVLQKLKKIWSEQLIEAERFPVIAFANTSLPVASPHSEPVGKSRPNANVEDLDISALPEEVREKLTIFLRWLIPRAS